MTGTESMGVEREGAGTGKDVAGAEEDVVEVVEAAAAEAAAAAGGGGGMTVVSGAVGGAMEPLSGVGREAFQYRLYARQPAAASVAASAPAVTRGNQEPSTRKPCSDSVMGRGSSDERDDEGGGIAAGSAAQERGKGRGEGRGDEEGERGGVVSKWNKRGKERGKEGWLGNLRDVPRACSVHRRLVLTS